MRTISRRGLWGGLAVRLRAGEPEWVDAAGGPMDHSCWGREGDGFHALAPREAFHDLRTTEEVADFQFDFEFRLAAGANSGVKYMVYRIDAWAKGAGQQVRARGLEFQLIDDSAADALKDDTHVTGALYGIQAPLRRPPNAADGRFHSGTIRREGGRARHWVDGALVLDARLDSPGIQAMCAQRKIPPFAELAARKRPVALQHHNSEVWFRNLRLRAI